jgi:hypothetical protein
MFFRFAKDIHKNLALEMDNRMLQFPASKPEYNN